MSSFLFCIWHVHVGFDFTLAWSQRVTVIFYAAIWRFQVGEVTNDMWLEGHSRARASDNVTHHCDALWHRLRPRCAAGGSISFTLSEKKPSLRHPRCAASNGLRARSHALSHSHSFVLPSLWALVPPACTCSVLTGSVWEGQMPRCKDRSSPEGRRAGWLPGSIISLQRMRTNGSISGRWQIATCWRCRQPTPAALPAEGRTVKV